MCKCIFIIHLSKWDVYIPPLLLVLRDLFRRGGAQPGRVRSGGWLRGHRRTDAIQAHRDREQRAQSLSRLEPGKLPAWTTGNGRKVSALVKKLFKTGNSVEREFVFFNVQHWVADQPHPGQAPWSSTVNHTNGLRALFHFTLFNERKKEYEDGGVGRLKKIWKELWDRKKIWSKYIKFSKNKLKCHYYYH